jgi:hypothetical protein
VNVPPELARLADRIGEAVTLAPEAMADLIEAALAEATNAAVWLPLERRRASHENYARHLHVYGVAPDLISTSVNRLVAVSSKQ